MWISRKRSVGNWTNGRRAASVPAGLGGFGAVERRRLRVVVLLSELDEVYEGAASRRETELSGFAPPEERTFTCGWCGGRGCVRCVRGRVTVTLRDPYDTGRIAAQVPEYESLTRSLARARQSAVEAELVWRGILGRLAWESTLRRSEERDEAFPFAELRRLLAVMPSLDAIEGLDWLAERLPWPIRIPSWAYRLELGLLKDEVRRLEREHLSEREISRALSISRRQVRNLGRRSAIAV